MFHARIIRFDVMNTVALFWILGCQLNTRWMIWVYLKASSLLRGLCPHSLVRIRVLPSYHYWEPRPRTGTCIYFPPCGCGNKAFTLFIHLGKKLALQILTMVFTYFDLLRAILIIIIQDIPRWKWNITCYLLANITGGNWVLYIRICLVSSQTLLRRGF